MIADLFQGLREYIISKHGAIAAKRIIPLENINTLRSLDVSSFGEKTDTLWSTYFSKVLNFSNYYSFTGKQKNCTPGKSYACKGACISKDRNCLNPLEGQAKNYAAFLAIHTAASTPGTLIAKQKPSKKSKRSPNTPQPEEKPTQNIVPRLKSGVADVPVGDLRLDPKRFQYKIVHGETGESGSLSGVKKFDPELAGIVQVWEDPSDGKTYVINGHNRVNLAKKAGVDELTVRYIKANTPEEARATGALTNIAEGKGTALDAAKFFRDTGLTQHDLQEKGIPLREKVATDALALADLNDGLFQRVALGELPMERATIIGSEIKDHHLQTDLVNLIESSEKKGKKITNDTIKELADMVRAAPTKEEEDGGLLSLMGFGSGSHQRSLAIEKAEVQADVKRRLVREKKLFGTVSKAALAKQLEKAGNQIDTEKNKGISEQADIGLRIFDQEKNYTGKVSQLLNKAAERIANGENSKKVKDETYDQIVKQLQETYNGGKIPSAGQRKTGAGGSEEQGSLFSEPGTETSSTIDNLDPKQVKAEALD